MEGDKSAQFGLNSDQRVAATNRFSVGSKVYLYFTRHMNVVNEDNTDI